MTVWVTRGSAIDPPKVLYKVLYKVCFTRCLARCFARCLMRCFTRCLTRCLREGRGPAGFTSTLGLTKTPVPRSIVKTVWPSGLRRWLQAPVRKGVGSNPTAVTLLARGRRVGLEGLTPFEGGGGAIRVRLQDENQAGQENVFKHGRAGAGLS